MNEHVALKRDADAYEADTYAWSRAQAELLRASRFDLADMENIIEEIESLGSEQLHAVESHIIQASVHLVKLAVSEDADSRAGWIGTVKEQRRSLDRRLQRNPSLRRRVPGLIVEAWSDIIEEACDGLRRDTERAHATLLPPFTEAQIFDRSFFPGD